MVNIMWSLVAVQLVATVLSGASGEPTCGQTLKYLNFESPRVSSKSKNFPRLPYVIDEARNIGRWGAQYTPYTKQIADAHWTPNDYLAGYYGQRQSRVEANTCMAFEFDSNRNSLVAEGGNQVLEVDLPKGCIGTECALQARFQVGQLANGKLESATLSYRFRFSEGFDFGRGGKLPGFCSGPKCATGCTAADGNNGWSARHMWQECDPALASERKCKHKFMSYLYHKNKWELCGDEVALSDERGVLEPRAGKWYTITSYISMNTAGPRGSKDVHKADGVVKTWIDGRLMQDQRNMEWRNFNDVTIGYMYFSVFAGGADYSWGSSRDNAIRFDDFKMTKGYCPPPGAREALPVAAPRGSPRRYQLKRNTDVTGPVLSRHWINNDNGCWTKCLNTRRCVAAVRLYGICYLKADFAEHRLKPLRNANLLYPATARELRMPLPGWNDPGDRSRPEICRSSFLAPLGTYKWPNRSGLCQVPRKSQCGGDAAWERRNPGACCQGVLVCLYQSRTYATCERPGEYRPANADPCRRAGRGGACGNNGACCGEGLDCEFRAPGDARCAGLRNPVVAYAPQKVTCSLGNGTKCGGSPTFMATFRNCCAPGLKCEYRKPTYSKCVRP